jgi:hypothetical protein
LENKQTALAGRSRINASKGTTEMKIAIMGLTLTAAMSVSSYAEGQYYNAAAAYGACQEDALHGLHYGLEGDCPNWEAWKANHMKAQTAPQRTSRRKYRLNQ